MPRHCNWFIRSRLARSCPSNYRPARNAGIRPGIRSEGLAAATAIVRGTLITMTRGARFRPVPIHFIEKSKLTLKLKSLLPVTGPVSFLSALTVHNFSSRDFLRLCYGIVHIVAGTPRSLRSRFTRAAMRSKKRSLRFEWVYVFSCRSNTLTIVAARRNQRCFRTRLEISSGGKDAKITASRAPSLKS